MPPRFQYPSKEAEKIEKEDARLWLQGLGEVLKNEGIDIKNPFDLARIKVRGNFQKAEQHLNFDFDTAGIDAAKEFAKSFDDRDFYAFMSVDEDLAYEDEMEDGVGHVEWIRDNMLDPGAMSKSYEAEAMNHAVFLYRMAKEGRLFIQDKNPNLLYGETNKFLLVGGSTAVVVSKPMQELKAEAEETGKKPNKVSELAWQNIQKYSRENDAIEAKRDEVLNRIAKTAEKPGDKSVQEVFDSCQYDQKERTL